MAQSTLPSSQHTADQPFVNRARLRRDFILRRAGQVGLWINPFVTYFFLWAPILLLVVFSFNDSRGVSVWRGFTLQWYQNIFNNTVGTDQSFTTSIMIGALQTSIAVSFVATLISTVIGTMAAMALTRTQFPGKRFLDGVLLLPVVIPEITQGISLLVYFNAIFQFLNESMGTDLKRGFLTVIIGHVAFNISYVVIVVRSRLANMNPRLEEAARDLGANEWRTFWRVTFPLLFPGILAGALLAFTLSLDDYVVTFFSASGGVTTLTVFVYGLLKTTVTPEINAISTLILAISTVLIGISLIIQGRDTSENR